MIVRPSPNFWRRSRPGRADGVSAVAERAEQSALAFVEVVGDRNKESPTGEHGNLNELLRARIGCCDGLGWSAWLISTDQVGRASSSTFRTSARTLFSRGDTLPYDQ